MTSQQAQPLLGDDETTCPDPLPHSGTEDGGTLSSVSVRTWVEEGIHMPLASLRTLAPSLKRLPQLVADKDPLFRDAMARVPAALLLGLLSAIAGGLLLPGSNTVTYLALSIGVVFASWILSFLYPLRQVWSGLLWISGPLCSYLLTEVLIGNIRFQPFLLYLSDMQTFLNLCWYYLIAACLYALTGRVRLSAGLCAVLGWVWGNLNAYVLQFRGRIVFPADVHAFRTAVMLTGDYDWTPTGLQMLSCGWLVLFLASLKLICAKCDTVSRDTSSPKTGSRDPLSRKGNRILRVTIILTGLLGMLVFFSTPLTTRLGVHPSQWFTQQNGVLLNFMINLKNSQVSKPQKYASFVAGMKEAARPVPASRAGKRPNLIVVMNEAFSDLRVLGNIRTNADPLSFFNSQTENTIRGKAYSSVIGGNTANSEYEFLTGNTMGFLPAGMVSYQIYTSPGDYSLTGQLNHLGYKTIALHPYERAGWNRVEVYQNYGFSEAHFIDDFENRQYVRNYVSDRSNYKELIRRFDAFREQDATTPLFFLNVTMQNHGSYEQTWDRLAHRIHVAEKHYSPASDVEGENAEVNQYLSLIKESDDAYRMLIEHFEQVEEPTLILMFGDHQPKLGDDFYKKVFGKAPEAFTPEETQRMYTVPFALWANYDIPEARDVHISLNYLSSLLLETANLPLTPYQRFLSDMHNEVPVINSMGLRGESGDFAANEQALTQAQRAYVSRYRAYQYNGIFDRKNRVEAFFNLPDDIME